MVSELNQLKNPISMIIVILIIIAIIAILIYMNKKIREKINQENKRILIFRTKIKKIKNNPDKKDLDAINQIARDYFYEKFGFGYRMTYLELAEKFSKLKKQEYSRFCTLMSDLLYSKKNIEKPEIKKAVSTLTRLLKS